MLGKILSILLFVAWIVFTIWLISVFATIAVSWKIVGVLAWVIIIAFAIWLVRTVFFSD